MNKTNNEREQIHIEQEEDKGVHIKREIHEHPDLDYRCQYCQDAMEHCTFCGRGYRKKENES